jgi:2-keto-3-deoxy-L-rhamnonate aldolase RhmA
MTHSSLKAVWDQDRAAIGGWVASGSEFSLDLYRRAQYDYIGIDCQHTAYNEAQAASMLQRVPAGSPAIIVRVSKNDATLIQRLCDAGADGIIVPMVNNAAEAEAAVAATRYPPRGVRSFGPNRPDLRADDLMALADRVSVFVMIETSDGLQNVDEITAVEGLAGVYVGPADLSIGLGLNPLTAFNSDQLLEPVERIRKACEANNIILGMHQMNAATATTWISRGVRLASLGSDGGLFLSAAIAALKDAKAGEGKARS